ncbi:MAG: PA2169 family four-helix-bundle protein [Fimbriimonadaceae bacterium]
MDQDLSIQKLNILVDHSESNSESSTVLNRVIAKAINARDEFLLWAGKADSITLYELCIKMKHRRDEFALQLQHEVASLGQEPATEQNFAGWIHQGWTRIRLAVEPENDYVIASEMIREEESMRLALTDAMESGFVPKTVQHLLRAEIVKADELRKTMFDLKVKLKPDDYVDLNKD